MKRELLLIIVALLPMLANAYDFEYNGFYYRIVPVSESSEHWAAVTRKNGNDYTGDVDIPKSVKNPLNTTFWVEGVDSYAFAGCTGLTSVTFPATNIKIRHHAFEGCSGLTSLTLFGSFETIEENAFSYCSGLKSIKVTESWGWNYYNSRENCNAIIESSSSKLIVGCMNTTIPNSVRSIGNYAFAGCTGLKSITIPNSVTAIGYGAFKDCSGLKSITIPSSVTSILPGAFIGCYFTTNTFVNNSSLTSSDNWGATFCDEETNDGLLIKGNVVVRCRPWATSVTIPNHITSIGEKAFSDCSCLTSIIIPNSVTSIGSDAFLGCSSLTSVTLQSNAIVSSSRDSYSSMSSIFGNKVNTYIIGEEVTTIGNYAFYGCSSLTSVTIPNSVTSIGEYAFYNCSGLTSITIPESVTSIGDSAFRICRSLTSLTIPNSVTSIGNLAFNECRNLTSVTIGNGVTVISNNAFSNCTSLTSITIPNGVTSIDINAFYNCASLISITIPSSITYIADHAFWNNSTRLTDVYCYAKDPPITHIDAFGSSISSVTLHVPESSVNLYNAVSPWSGFGTIVPLEEEEIHAYIDGIYYNLKEGNAEVTYGYHVYSGSVIIPETITYKGKTYTVVSIGDEAFSECDGLTSITIPEGVISIGEFAFYDCSSLTSIIIPEGVTTIGNYAFRACFNLAEVTIPESMMSIGNSAFRGCRGLTDVYCYAKNVPSTNVNAFNDSPITSTTLHVPKGSVGSYKSTSPWSGFGTIVSLEGMKCDTPTISYANGELIFSCKTKGAVCRSTITDTDITSYSSKIVQLSVTYHISVYATKEGYDDSDVATATLCWIDVEPATEGIVNEDAVTEVKAMPVLIQTQGDTITIQGAAEGTSIAIYSIDGKQYGSAIAEKDRTNIATSLQAGSVAIVKIGEKTVKVLLK